MMPHEPISKALSHNPKALQYITPILSTFDNTPIRDTVPLYETPHRKVCRHKRAWHHRVYRARRLPAVLRSTDLWEFARTIRRDPDCHAAVVRPVCFDHRFPRPWSSHPVVSRWEEKGSRLPPSHYDRPSLCHNTYRFLRLSRDH